MRKRLRTAAVATVGCLLFGAGGTGAATAPLAVAAGAGVSARLDGSAPGLRVILDVRAGMVANASLSPKGDSLRIDLRGATRDQVLAILAGLNKPGSLIKAARAFFLNARDAYVIIEFRRSLELADQVLTAGAADRSRWELVLADPAPAAAPGKPLELKDVQLALRDELLEIRLVGSADLTAEVSMPPGPAHLVIELPGTSVASVERFISTFRPGPYPLVKRVTSGVEKGVPRIVFELFQDVDLVDSEGVLRDGTGTIRMALAPDAAPNPALRLQGVTARAAGAELAFSVDGVDPASVHAYTLNDPPRLVLDVLGASPEQARAAAETFKSPHPGVLGARAESTRLGSARLVFDLSSSVPLVAHGGARPGAGTAYTLALRMPAHPDEPGYTPPNLQPRAVSIAQRGPRVDAKAPLLVIRPVALEAPAPDREPVLGGPGLMGLLARALVQDPKYQAVRKDYDIAAEGIPQARAALLPTVSLDYQRAEVRQDIARASNAAFPTGGSRFPNRNLSLNLTQPLLKLPALARLEQAKVAAEQARFNLMAGEQDLILRLATSYLNACAARDGVELAEAELAATGKQLELARSRMAGGLASVTQVHEAQARFGLAKAKVLEAKHRLDDADQALREIVGRQEAPVSGFKGDFAASGPIPATAEPWVNAAVEQNLALMTRKLATQIADLEIRRQKSGFAPTINLVASSSRVEAGGSLYGSGQQYTSNEVGVRLSVPLFEGGSTASLVREASSRLGKAQDEQEQELRRTERLTRSAFSSVVASLESQQALRQAVVAQESALEAREEGLRSGLTTPVAVIDAYRLYYAAKRDYLQARYDYLVNRLKLKQAVGTLSRADLEDLNALLQP